MRAWSTREAEADVMGASVDPAGAGTPKASAPPSLKNGGDLREAGYLVAVGSKTARYRRKNKQKFLTVGLLVFFLLLLSLALAMTVLYVKQKRHKPQRVCMSKECLRSAANLALSMDRSADPCEDFYQFVCGNWAEEHPRPDAFSSYDWFRDKQLKVFHMVREFLVRNSTQQPRPVLQAKEMYAACMDTEQIDKQGIQPVQDILEAVGLPRYPTYLNITDLDYSSYDFDWLAVVSKVKTFIGMDILIGFDIFTDPKNATMYRLVMGSPETINPFPSMYTEKRRHRRKYSERRKTPILVTNEMYSSELTRSRKSGKSSDASEKSRQTFIVFYAELIKLFVLETSESERSSNLSDSELDQMALQTASDYYTLNSEINEIDYDNDTQTDDAMSFADYTVVEIQEVTDDVVETNNGTASPLWQRYLELVFGDSDVTLDFEKDKIMVAPSDMKYLSTIASLISKEPLVKIELFIWIKAVEVLAAHTTTEMRTLFALSRDEERGRRRADAGAPSRSLLCAGAVNEMLGMAVAYGIVDHRFLNVTKPKIKTMLTEMKNALARSIGKAKWMDDNTKLASFEKILEMRSLIGFPDWLIEDGRLEQYYKGIEIKADDHLGNMMNIIQERVKSKLNKYHDYKNYSWATDPTEVNAYHTYQENTITVPMVMLQYPFYDLGLDSLNYGSLGTIIGHEITHGFDNFGRQFDKTGNLLQWWTNDTIESFVNMTQCFVDQYSGFYVPELDEHVDGERTLGENIADNGGVHEALGALREHLARRAPEPRLPGFEEMTPEQLFFLSFGNLWCSEATTDYLSAELDDEHSPQRVRARGALQNTPEFAHAWRCRPGAKMNPRHKCILF